ncbi:MAG: gliding motility-associated-like protein [Salibacteraceae bacterium]|jgi:gliding motility-associated-like protein
MTTTKNFISKGIHLLRTQTIVPFSILAFFLLATSLSVQASHYSGGEITYTSTGPNQYLVTLKVYRDCNGISFGTTQLLNYSSANCGVNSSLTLNLQSTEDITPLCSTATSACGGTGPVGVGLLVFQGTLNLPPGCDDWILSTTSCCRNAAITNISGSSNNEMYFEAHLDNTAGLNNNSPSFSTIPQLFGCVGQTINFQQLAFDSDGDSLVYTLVNALQSSGVSVTYVPGFSGINPFTVPLTFNSQTGQITFTPNTPQVAVVNVLIEEYRNGVLIGSIMRDIQFIIDDCTNTIPEISGIDGVPGVYDITTCEGANVCFDILGSDVDAGQNVTLNYDNTIPGAVFTQGGTSTNPIGTFCWSTNLGDQGTYSFTVFAEDDHCPLVGQNSAVYTVNVIPNPNDPVIASPDLIICAGETVLLTATTTSTSGSTYQWTPLNGLSTPSSASTNATPTSTTSYTVELTYTDGCSSQDFVTVTIANDPTANAFPNNADACGGGNFLLSGLTDQTSNNFEWFDPSLSSLGSGTVTGAQSTLNITVPTATGTYLYILVVTNPVTGCQSADTVYLTVGNPPVLPSCVNIYVSTTASAAGAGTQADPTSLLQGLSMAACNNAVIKLATGTYNISNPISIGSFSTLEGGFNQGSGWIKTSQPGATTINRTTANPEGAVNAQRLVAMYGNGATGFRLQDLTISTSNANLPGMSTYALHLSACSDYTIVRTQLLPGNAANGAAGSPGTNGANGANGINGLNGDSDQQNDARTGGNGGAGAGAGGGASGTGAPAAAGCCTGGVNGGAGGAATNFRAGAGGGGGARGGQEDRDGGIGGIGGAYFGGITNTCGGGAGQENGCNSVTGSCNAALSGDNGCAGITGVTGIVGAAGPAGNHLAGFWVPGGLAGTGTDGQGGQGGRGGGGGAGEGGIFCTDGAGASGGGGGGGGQGGTGGFGVRGGGSSIGAYLFNNGANGIINDSRVISGLAGAGGAGGAGGLGGNGGAGGVGGQDDINDYEIGCGGNGGNGGNGRNGGNGGNGAPGVSIPVYLSGGSALTLSDINFNLAAQPVITVTNVNCTNTNVQFQDMSNSGATWDHDVLTNNATPATGAMNPSNTQYSVIDRYDVAFGANQYTGFQNIAFSQTILPEITSTATQIGVDTFQLCEGDFSTFDMNLFADIYVWDFDGAIANPGSVQTVSNQFNTTGFFEILGYGITDCCGLTPIDTVYLYVIPLPVATGSGNAAICQGESTTLSLTGLTPTDSVVWSPTINSVPLSNSSISVSPLATTTYTATVYSTLTGGGQTVVGCPISIDFLVTVNPLPAVTMSATLVICSNDGSATATTSGGSYNFVWDNGVTDNGVASSTIINLAYGNYAVTITDAITGCSIRDSIDVLPSPTQPIVYIQSLTGTCEGASDGTATANTSGGTAPFTYVWSTAYVGQTISNLPGGLYSVTVTDNNGCSSSVDFDIPESHAPDLDVFANGPICYGDSVQFELTSHDAATLIYDIGGGNQTLIFTDDTMYLTYYSVTSNITMNFTSVSLGICVNVLGTSQVIIVIPPPTATISNNGPICFGEDGEFTITGTTDAIVNYTLNGVPNQNITLTGGTATIPVTAPPTNSTLVIDSITVGNCAIDTVVSNTLIVNPVSNSTENAVACENATYTYPDGSTELIIGNSSHISTLVNSFGCDSLVTTNVTMNPTYSSIVAIDVCENDSYTYPDGTVATITASTSQTSNLVTSAGCDSVIVTNVTMLPAYSTTETAAICEGEDYTFPDGTIQTNILADVLYTSSFTTVDGCDSTIITDLTVNPSPIVDAGADQQICDGGVTTLTASNPSGATIAWNNGISDGIAFTPATNQWYNVTATSAAGCVSVDSAYVTVNPTYSSIVAIDVCENDSYTYPDGTVATITASTSQTSSLLTAAGCDSVIVTNVTMLPAYSTTETAAICEGEDYTFPDGTIQTNILADVLYTSSFTTVDGCDSTIITDLTVNPLPIVDAGADQQICDGDLVTLTASNPSGATLSWDNGVLDGVAFAPSGTVIYTATVTSPEGCVNSDDAIVVVNPSPTASFSANVLDGCAPLTVEFFSSSTGSVVDCVWDFGDGNTFIGCADVQNVYNQAGAQTVSLTVTDINGCTSNATYVDYINVYEVPDASFYASEYELDILHTDVDFTNTSSNATNYVWYFGDSSTSTQEDPSHNYPDDYVGNYQVVLVAINGVCTDTATAMLTMDEILIYYVPNTFTPDGDQHNQIFKPIFSSGLDPFDFNMTIYNRWGEKVFETNDVNYGWDANYLGLPVQDGTYIWTMEFKERTSEERHRVNGHVNVLR